MNIESDLPKYHNHLTINSSTCQLVNYQTMRKLLFLLMLGCSLTAWSQIGEHRNDFSIGGNAGLVMSNIGFDPTVPQTLHLGLTAGLSARYVCEKYFKTICSVYAEANITQAGWKEDILTAQDQPVINSITGKAEKYSRTITYLQIPVFAHLAWGKEEQGFNFFFQAGPQVGFYLGESTSANFDTASPNLTDRSNTVVAQYDMPVEKKFDYGIAAGAGVEYSHRRFGHFLMEARYYYGLGNIYGDTKRDYFGKSNVSNIVVKAAYLFSLGNKNKVSVKYN